MKPTRPLQKKSQRVWHDTLDFIQVPGYPSAIRVFALTHSRRIVVQRLPWLISFSLDDMRPSQMTHGTGHGTGHTDHIVAQPPFDPKEPRQTLRVSRPRV